MAGPLVMLSTWVWVVGRLWDASLWARRPHLLALALLLRVPAAVAVLPVAVLAAVSADGASPWASSAQVLQPALPRADLSG